MRDVNNSQLVGQDAILSYFFVFDGTRYLEYELNNRKVDLRIKRCFFSRESEKIHKSQKIFHPKPCLEKWMWSLLGGVLGKL